MDLETHIETQITTVEGTADVFFGGGYQGIRQHIARNKVMDTARILEKYEANHAKDTCTADFERTFGDWLERDLTGRKDAYSPSWAEQQRVFLALCR